MGGQRAYVKLATPLTSTYVLPPLACVQVCAYTRFVNAVPLSN